MHYDLRFIPGEDFLRMDAEGHFDMAQSRQIFSDLIHGIVHSKVPRVLIDTRDASTKISAAQVLSIAQVCNEIAPEGVHRVAILNQPKDDLDRGELFAEYANERGWNIRVFKEFEAAFEWLVGADQALGIRSGEEFPRMGTY